MTDLHATYSDASLMYDFLAVKVCQNVSDITVMSDKKDFFHLFEKPKYEGDFYTQIFDWNINKEGLQNEMTKLHKCVN